MEALLSKIESYGFECEAGPLALCVDWQKLKVHVLLATAQPAAEPVALLWRCLNALKLAGAMCDRVPHRAHTAEPDGALRDLGVMVNKQDDGSHGYRVIYDALEDLEKYLTTPTAQPAAEPTLQGDLMHFFEHEFESGSPLDVLTRRLNDVGGASSVRKFDKHVQDLMRRYAALALSAQPAAECKAGGACRWRGNASAEFLAEHEAQQQEPLTTDEQIDMMWRRAGIANNARGAFFAGVAAGIRAQPSQDAKDAARYRDDLISCRGMVKTELNHYERLALVHGKTAVAENYEKEAQRLSDLLDRIDAAMKETP